MKYVGIFLFLFPLCIKAQDVSKFRFTYSHLEGYSYRKLIAVSDYQSMADTLNAMEKGLRAMSNSISISRRLSNDFEINAGIGWSSFGERIDTNVSLGLTNFRSVYKSLDIPVTINKIWRTGNSIEYVLGIGGSYSVLLSHDVTYRLINSNSQVTERAMHGLNKDFLGVRMELGIRYSIDQNWLIGLGIQGRYSFTSVTQNSLKRYPYQVGILLSLFRSF